MTTSNNAPASDGSFPLVSVIIPYYNAEEYFKDTLISCIGNTYKNMEIIIVDDYSNPPLNLGDFKIDPLNRPIRIFRNRENKGPSYSRNVGIAQAKGEYLAFLDADDLWRPSILEKQMKAFGDNPHCAWGYTDGHYIHNGALMKKPNSSYHGFASRGFPKNMEVNEYHLKGYNYMTFSSTIFQRNVFRSVGCFSEELAISEDWEFFVRVAQEFNAFAIDEPLMYYRIHDRGRATVCRDNYLKVNKEILTNLYINQGLLGVRTWEYDLALARIYQRAGIQRLNKGLNKDARKYLFDPKTSPLRGDFKMVVLRILSYLPNPIYFLALKVFDRI